LLALCLEPRDRADLAALLARIRGFGRSWQMSRAGSVRAADLPLTDRVNEQ
jgi:hypothetical protein